MNGTTLRTAGAIVIAINQAISVIAPPDFGNDTLNMAYKVISFFFTVAALAINTYYNNDYTSEGEIGTMVTRTLKDDPTMVVDVYDPDEDIDEIEDDDEIDETEEYDEEITGNEVEQK